MKFKLVLIIVLTLGTRNAVGQWVQTNGPYGGTVNAFSSIGTVLFAGATNGVYQSIDSGVTWTHASQGLPHTSIQALTTMGTILLVGTENSGVFYSIDSARSWTQSSLTSPDSNVLALAVIGSDLLAGTYTSYTSGFYESIYESTDSGKSWTGPNPDAGATSFAVSGGYVYASDGGAIFHSADSGKTWSIPKGSWNEVYSVAAHDQIVFTATEYGFELSTDRGMTWKLSTAPYTSNWPNASMIGTKLFASSQRGIFRSTDTGKSWILMSPDPIGSIVYSFYSFGGDIFAGMLYGGIFRSTDSGISWKPSNNGIIGTDVRSLATIGTNVFAGTWGDGTFTSSDDGQIWNTNSIETSQAYVWSAISNGTDIYVGTEGGGVHQSTDSGATWTSVGLSGSDVLALAAEGTNIYAVAGGTVFRNIVGDTDWIKVNTGLKISYVTRIFANDSFLLAGSDSGVFRSTDSGMNWEQTSVPLGYTYILALAQVGTTLFAGTDSGIIISNDNGTHWAATKNGLSGHTVNCFASYNSNLFANTANDLFLSTDRGTTWTAVDSGLGGLVLTTLAVSGQDLFVGTNGAGVWRRPLSEMIGSSGVTEAPHQASAITIYPNPVSHKARINFSTNASSPTSVTIFDVLGNSVTEIFDGILEAGNHSLTWDASIVPPGTYYARIPSGNGDIQTVKVVKE
jgi:hypothetical protein